MILLSHDLTIGGRTFHTVPELAAYYDSPEFEQNYTYAGHDLGCACTRTFSRFKLWSPAAEKAVLRLYKAGSANEPEGRSYADYDMERAQEGTFELTLNGDFHRTYYTYVLTISGETIETADPYARAAGVNGWRSMAVDLTRTDPDGWQEDSYAFHGRCENAIVWEIQVRDFSFNKHSGMQNKGMYLAFTEEGTVLDGDQDFPTGTDYLKKLGITHVQLMPLTDFATVDESHMDEEQYNWGYDPMNLFVPEGSYAKDPLHGEGRIRELKQMILALHRAGIGVIMDIVLNHTFYTDDSFLNLTMPYYYYRTDAEGRFSNATGCGNETASERSMCHHLMLDVVNYWAREYHIDGFRFDLMGTHDTDTMNDIRASLDMIQGKDLLVYGEPWTAAPSSFQGRKTHARYLAVKENLDKLDERIFAFDDETRDLIRGNCFQKGSLGYATQGGFVEQPMFNASVGFGSFGLRGVKYASCHDNQTLWDKLTDVVSRDGSGFDEPELIRLAFDKLAAAIVFTSQGMSFMLGGQEFGRSKHGNSNSYKSPTSENALHWKRTKIFQELVSYYEGLIAVRKSFSPFEDSTGKARDSIRLFMCTDQVIAYYLPGQKKEEPVGMVVCFNASNEGMTPELCEKPGETFPDSWEILVNESRAGLTSLGHIDGRKFPVFPRSALIASSTDILH